MLVGVVIHFLFRGVFLVKIATWNVNSIRTRLEHLIEWAKSAQPDIILLQEIKTINETFPSEPLEDLGYNLAILGQKSYNGVAILSKHRIEDVTFNLPTLEGDTNARYIEAFTGGVRVASVYVPNGQEVGGEKYYYKLQFMKALKDHLIQVLKYKESFVLGGDFNVAPSDEDLYDIEKFANRILTSPPERQALREIMHLGFTDALRALHPKKMDLYTWWDYRQGSWAQNKGLRIDHLLLSPEAADKLEFVDVDLSTRGLTRPSDHAPVVCALS